VPRPEVCEDLKDCTEASIEGFKVPCLPDDRAAYFQAFCQCSLFHFCPWISFTNIIAEFNDCWHAQSGRMDVWYVKNNNT